MSDSLYQTYLLPYQLKQLCMSQIKDHWTRTFRKVDFLVDFLPDPTTSTEFLNLLPPSESGTCCTTGLLHAKFFNTHSTNCAFEHSSNNSSQLHMISSMFDRTTSNYCCITYWNSEDYFRLFLAYSFILNNSRFNCLYSAVIGSILRIFRCCHNRHRQIRINNPDFCFWILLFLNLFMNSNALSSPQFSNRLLVMESTKSDVPMTPAYELTNVTAPPILVIGFTSPYPTVVIVRRANQRVLLISTSDVAPFQNTRQQQANNTIQNIYRAEIKMTGCCLKRHLM